jgi:hypothetical protein
MWLLTRPKSQGKGGTEKKIVENEAVDVEFRRDSR